MKHTELAKKGTYAGTGAGLVMFMLVGVFPGSLIGGAAGLWISNLLMGEAAGASLIPRVITSLSMVVGIMGAAATFVIGASVVGWAVGTALEAMHKEHPTELAEARHNASH